MEGVWGGQGPSPRPQLRRRLRSWAVIAFGDWDLVLWLTSEDSETTSISLYDASSCCKDASHSRTHAECCCTWSVSSFNWVAWRSSDKRTCATDTRRRDSRIRQWSNTTLSKHKRRVPTKNNMSRGAHRELTSLND
eukprot:scaffold168638_cov27-Tisochrysis_lutea.AAC.2